MEGQKGYFDRINTDANHMMIRLISWVFLIGAVVYFTARYIFVRADITSVLAESSVLLVLGLVSLLLRRVKGRSGLISLVLGLILSTGYIILFVFRYDYAFVTLWSAIFIFIAVSLLYINKIILITQIITVTALELYALLFMEPVDVNLDGSDHFIRIAIVLMVMYIALFANGLYRKRLITNLQQIDEILEQKEELTSLYEEVQANEEELREQNVALHHTYEEIDRLAYYDSLTDLPKRRKLFDDIEHKINVAKEAANEHFTLMLIDLDNFKNVNDLHGHDVGDHFLLYTSEVISKVVGELDCQVYRIGSDDFVILTSNTTEPEPIIQTANNLLEAFKEPLEYELYSIKSTISIGISEFPENGKDAKEMLRNADMALQQAKTMGKGNYVFFDKRIEDKLIRKLNLQHALVTAVDNKELSIYYQPIIDLKSGDISGFEALLRWDSKDYGAISPVEFIPYAEENMAIIPIGLWVIEESMKFIKKINEELASTYKVSVNVSTIQLNNRQFLNQFDSLLKSHAFEPQLLDFEVTESTFMESYDEAVILLDSLRAMGITISLDDFGTGYSSLSYLQQLPVDHLKIDRSFIRTLNTEDNPLVETIINMAHRLHMEVVAEGIETDIQLKTIVHQHCNYGQGYLFSKPMPEGEVRAFISDFEQASGI